MYRFLSILMSLLCICLMKADDGLMMEFLSFEECPLDISARINQRNDINGDPTALLKVFIPRLKGDITVSSPVKIGVEESEDGELLIYLGDGSKHVTVRHPDFLPFEYTFEKPLKGKCVYKLTLGLPDSYLEMLNGNNKILTVAGNYWSKRNYEMAISLYEQLPDDPEALYYRARYRQMKKDYESAAVLYEAAAEKGYAEANSKIGAMYYMGQGVSQDFNKAVKYLKLAAGDASSQNILGYCYLEGNGVLPDLQEAIRWFRLAADKGNRQALCQLGRLYFEGKGVPVDYSEAYRLFMASADQGYTEAKVSLGYLCVEERCGQQNYADALKWWKEAAAEGSSEAKCGLGDMYRLGKGIPQDAKQAVNWYRKSAEEGNAVAQCHLGKMYEGGNGVKRDYKEAMKWYRMAASYGYDEAYLNIGHLFINGNGVSKDSAEALKWYQLAAEKGNSEAIEMLKMYQK